MVDSLGTTFVRFAKFLEVPLLLIGLIFLVYVLMAMPMFDIRTMHLGWLGVAFLLQFFAFLGASVGWCLTLRAWGGDVSVRTCIVHTGLLLVGKYIPGAWFGVIGRGVAAAKTLGSKTAAVATLADQLIYHCIALALSALFILSPTQFILVISLAGLMLVYLIKWISKRLGFGFDPTIATIFFGIVQWLFGVFGFLAAALAIPILNVDLWKLAAVYPTAVLAGLMLPFLPAGIGVREGVIVWLLTEFIGASAPAAVTLAAITRLVMVLRDIVAGCLSAYLRSR